MANISKIELPNGNTYDLVDKSAVPSTSVGSANGVAPLNSSSLIDGQYLPSYVDDVVEGYYYDGSFYEDSSHTIVITGETGKIYIDLTESKSYRWSGTVFVEITSGGHTYTAGNGIDISAGDVISIDTDDVQEKLVSGTNIKTINNTSLLGNGNLSIEGVPHVDLTQAQYDALTPAEKNNGTIYFITDGSSGGGEVTDVKVNGVSVVSSGTANITIPTNISSFTNDSGYITSYTETDPTVPSWAKESSKPSYIFSEINSTPTTISGYGITDGYTKTEVDNLLLALPEPMIFKGSLGTGGTITTLPSAAAANEGFVYKVITDGTYASQSAKIGDAFISDGSSWVLIPSGDEPNGTVTSVGISNATNGGLSVSSSPITSSGTITVGHSNVLNSAQTTSGVYPIKIDKNGHISEYGSAVSIPTQASDIGAQPTLVSGTNIKTVNNTSLLGSGNISISSDVTGVKGDLESTYRTGNVNITPANIGAQPQITYSTTDIEEGDPLASGTLYVVYE